MAQVLAVGPMARVELEAGHDGGFVATCVEHSEFDGRLAPPGDCSWETSRSSWEEVVLQATSHADTGQ